MSISKEFFQENRRTLSDRIPEGTAVFIFAGVERALSRDSEYRFLPDRNYYYLTGLSDPEGKLIITKSEVMLFAKVRDELAERWQGKRKDLHVLAEISGIDPECIYPLDDFYEKVYKLLKEQGLRAGVDGSSIGEDTAHFRGGLEDEINIEDILTSMRMVKREPELEAIRKAAKITEEALKEMKRHIAEGVTELELYTALEYGMARRGSLIQAFPTIVSNGANTFYLHHSDPEREDGERLRMGGQLQVDVGARCDGYCADISRVYFLGDAAGDDDRRFKLLELIKALRVRAFDFIKPGESFDTLNKEMRAMTGEWLVGNGLLPADHQEEDVRKYYWHNTSHHLGLDVHDIALKDKLFEKGNCLAVEPGVYIPEWGTGFRIEDDVLVTDDGCELLSSGYDGIDDILIP